MKTLVYVEHEGGQIKDATLAAVTAASKLGEVHALVAGSNVGAVADAATKIAGVGKVHVADAAHLESRPGRERRSGRCEADGDARRVHRSGHDHRQEHRSARRRLARRDADFRDPVGRGREHVHPPDLRRQRHRHGSHERRQEGADRSRHGVRQGRARRRQRLGRAGRYRQRRGLQQLRRSRGVRRANARS